MCEHDTKCLRKKVGMHKVILSCFHSWFSVQLSNELIQQCSCLSIPEFLNLVGNGVQWTKEVRNRAPNSVMTNRDWKCLHFFPFLQVYEVFLEVQGKVPGLCICASECQDLLSMCIQRLGADFYERAVTHTNSHLCFKVILVFCFAEFLLVIGKSF